jgi:site-specific recombinase XerD
MPLRRSIVPIREFQRQRREHLQLSRPLGVAPPPQPAVPTAFQIAAPPGCPPLATRLLADLVLDYLTDLEAQGRSPKTRSGYQLLLGQFLTFAEDGLGHQLALGEFTLELARRYALYLQRRRGRYLNNRFCDQGDGRPLSPFTIAGHLRALKAFSSWLSAPEQGLIESNRMALLKLPRLPELAVRSVAREDFEAVLATCDRQTQVGCRDGAILCLTFDAGPRLGEVMDAELDDVDLANRSLRIRWETVKTHRERTIYFGPRTAQWLSRYVRGFRPTDPPTGARNIFLSVPTRHSPDGGDRMTESSVERMFRRRCLKAGVTPFSPHRGRHTFGPNFLLGGGDEFSLQQILGHTTRHTTAIYARMRDDQVRQQHRRASPLERWGKRPDGSR